MERFIEVTTLNTVYTLSSERNVFGDYDRITKAIEEVEFINISDIARVCKNGLVLKTEYPNGDNFTKTKETYEEIKELIKKSYKSWE